VDDPTEWYSPDGAPFFAPADGSFPLPDRTRYSLIAKIGSGGAAFALGSVHIFTPSATGTLYLGINDDYVSDNAGLFRAFVTTPIAVSAPLTLPQTGVRLDQNIPNPFNPHTNIGFTLESPGIVNLRVYDASGRLVKTLVEAHFERGSHIVPWDGRSESGTRLASGTYFYDLRVDGVQIGAKKAVIVK
jgi:hypothetical protein